MEDQKQELSQQMKAFCGTPENIEAAANSVMQGLIDDLILNVAFNVHYSVRKEVSMNSDEQDEKLDDYKLEDNPNVDIFGVEYNDKITQDCICAICKMTMAASRYAPHLARCMGWGRTSSRIASRRIANNSKEVYTGISDDDDDADWTMGSDKRRKKHERNNVRRSKNPKTRNGDKTSSENGGGGTVAEPKNATINYDGMTNEEKRNLLTQICGVISEHTRKLCTRSMKCSQHSEEQRRAVRALLLAAPTSEMVQVDVDTYEEGDAQSMRDSLGRSWEQEHSNTPSPADSASTSSSSSKKRDKNSKSKGKGSSKSHKSSPSFPGANHQRQAN